MQTMIGFLLDEAQPLVRRELGGYELEISLDEGFGQAAAGKQSVETGEPIEAADDGIAFKKCDAITILLAAGTDYLNRRDQGWKGEHPHKRITAQLAAAEAKPFESLLDEHVRDYQDLFNRCSIDFGTTAENLGLEAA